MAGVAALDDFGGHVLDGPAEGVGTPLPALRRQELSAQPEVGQDDVAVFVKQYVLQFDVTVNDAIL